MAGDPVLSVDNLVTTLTIDGETIPAVDGVSFSVGAGETLGIVGESGSGKSMTALSIMQVLPRPIGNIQSGSIRLGERELTELDNAQMSQIRGKEIGMILQDPHTSLNPVFSIGNQVKEAFRLNRKTPSAMDLLQQSVDVLKSVNVADAERRISAYPHQMSGGMKQRVVGAIAIAGAPKVIIADEPTTALDVTIQLQYLKLLQDIQKETGTALIFITHDLGIVANICTSLVVMYAGQIVEAGTVEDVFTAPSHPYTQALLRSVPSVDTKVDRLYAIEGQPPALSADRKGCRFADRCPLADAHCRENAPAEVEGKSGAPTHRVSCWKVSDDAIANP